MNGSCAVHVTRCPGMNLSEVPCHGTQQAYKQAHACTDEHNRLTSRPMHATVNTTGLQAGPCMQRFAHTTLRWSVPAGLPGLRPAGVDETERVLSRQIAGVDETERVLSRQITREKIGLDHASGGVLALQLHACVCVCVNTHVLRARTSHTAQQSKRPFPHPLKHTHALMELGKRRCVFFLTDTTSCSDWTHNTRIESQQRHQQLEMWAGLSGCSPSIPVQQLPPNPLLRRDGGMSS